MKLLCDSKYIVLPVSHQAPKRSLRFYDSGQLVYDLQIELDFINPDVEFYLNIERFDKKELELLSEPDMDMEIKKSDAKYQREENYIGKHRSGFHFSSQRGWLNDPNGLVYYEGLYHMFYQHNPVGCKWGNMHWGHAVSTDLVHWEEKEVALYPDEFGTMFSGSAIVDKKNVAGLKQNEDDVILLFYTAAGNSDAVLSKPKPFTQCMAYSVDGGHTFKKYSRNPVIPHIEHENRDPKVIYDPVNDIYLMVLYLTGSRFMLLTSSNLLEWNKVQEIVLKGDAECPDFYPLPVDGDKNNIKWVFSGASDRYLTGSFNDKRYYPETESRQLQYSGDSYASQTWSDIPSADGRRLRVAWNRFDIPCMPYNMSMTFPCEMQLKTFSGELCLCAYPVSEIENLYDERYHDKNIRVSPSEKYSRQLTDKLYDITFEIAHEQKGRFGISLFGIGIEGDFDLNELTCLGNKAPTDIIAGNIELRMLIDVNSIEIFINKGKAFMTIGHIQDYNMDKLTIEAIDNEIMLDELHIAVLRNIHAPYRL